ncbi:MAG: RNA-processing protein, partial [Candidatus Micrarchaeia archaeon]
MDPAVKREIEKLGNVKLSLGEEGEIIITSKNPVSEWKSIDIVKAIGRGFNPRVAMKLFNEEYVFKLVNL